MSSRRRSQSNKTSPYDPIKSSIPVLNTYQFIKKKLRSQRYSESSKKYVNKPIKTPSINTTGIEPIIPVDKTPSINPTGTVEGRRSNRSKSVHRGGKKNKSRRQTKKINKKLIRFFM